jgi:hypothetical protein
VSHQQHSSIYPFPSLPTFLGFPEQKIKSNQIKPNIVTDHSSIMNLGSYENENEKKTES